MVGNPSRFCPERSSSWVKSNDVATIAYLDNSHCLAEKGEDIVSVGNLSVRIPLGVGSAHGCDAFGVGFLGMSKVSDFLRAIQETSESLILSFSFKDNITGEGENQFAIGGLAGLKEEDIIWIHDRSEGLWSGAFQLDMPYISYNGRRCSFAMGHVYGSARHRSDVDNSTRGGVGEALESSDSQTFLDRALQLPKYLHASSSLQSQGL
jgi:hypothetical protein